MVAKWFIWFYICLVGFVAFAELVALAGDKLPEPPKPKTRGKLAVSFVVSPAGVAS